MGSLQLAQALSRLQERYGAPPSSPPATPLESLLLVLFADDVSCGRGEQAIANLSEAGLLATRRLAELSVDELAELIRPLGNAPRKANRLHRLLEFVVERYDGSLPAMFETDAESLRGELLALRGVGPETADTILLLAAGKPSFVVDLAAHRVLKRHGWIEFEAGYEAIKECVESGLERDPIALAALHALLARVGRDHCRKQPQCEGCPLAELLPPRGPLEEEEW